ncbi:MAG TPA: hypothetical protein ENH89_08270, partial [Aurantimonas coralicida]|nr:hypothetical protein [Aurantimonas coralicida]
MSHEPQAKARVAVIGAGTMGKAIAGTFAQGGIPTILVSRDPSRAGLVETGVELVSELPRDPPCMIVEAVPEEMQLKIGVFLSVERLYGASLPVMASNTSGLPLQEIADRLERPDRFLGIHWFHPAGALPLVETVRVAQTSDESLSVALDLLAATGPPLVSRSSRPSCRVGSQWPVRRVLPGRPGAEFPQADRQTTRNQGG